jgi:hypothetical protein
MFSLEDHVFGEIGAKRIEAIDSAQVLEPIWLAKPDTTQQPSGCNPRQGVRDLPERNRPRGSRRAA